MSKLSLPPSSRTAYDCSKVSPSTPADRLCVTAGIGVASDCCMLTCSGVSAPVSSANLP